MELILNPNFAKRKPVLNTMAGEKIYKLSTFTDQLTAKPGDTIKVRIPKLTWNPDECIVPSSLCLEFNIASANAKSWVLNNVCKKFFY